MVLKEHTNLKKSCMWTIYASAFPDQKVFLGLTPSYTLILKISCPYFPPRKAGYPVLDSLHTKTLTLVDVIYPTIAQK